MNSNKKKILVITHSDDRHFYVCNALVNEIGNDISFIINAKTKRKRNLKNLKRRIVKHPIKKIVNILLNLVFVKYLRIISEQVTRLESHYFAGNKMEFFKLHKDKILLDLNSINFGLKDRTVVEKIKAFNADIIIVFGADLISKEIIDCSNLSLNLHTGLSPYYRGGRSNFWPFINEDWQAFGVTLHRLTSGIDSGEIFRTGRINFTGAESYPKINCEAIILGTSFIIDAINQLRSGQELKFVPQWETGKLYHNIDFNGYVARKYCKISNCLNTVTNQGSKKEVLVVEDGVKCSDQKPL